MDPVELTDGTVVLRPLQDTDIDTITEACQDPETQRWTTVPVPYLREHAVEFVTGHVPRPVDDPTVDGPRWSDNPLWTVCLPEDRRYGGAIDLRPDGDGSAEVGYALAPWLRGHGHMQRALRLACRWAFEEAGMSRVVWYAHVGNVASRRTAEAVGFQVLDGVLRQHCLSRGERHDAWVGDLLPGDLR